MSSRDFYESNEAMLAQLQAGAVYDLIVPSDYMVGIMIEEGLLTRAQRRCRSPTWGNLDDKFTELPYDPGPEYSAAYQFGTTGLGVNTPLVGEDFDPSWALVFDPELTTTFPGGVSVLNDPRETMGAALKYLGYSLNDSEVEHLRKPGRHCRRQGCDHHVRLRPIRRESCQRRNGCLPRLLRQHVHRVRRRRESRQLRVRPP